MESVISLVPEDTPPPSGPDLRVVVDAPGRPEHLVREPSGYELHVPAPGWGAGSVAGDRSVSEEVHRWHHRLGRSLRGHRWARTGNTVVDLGPLEHTGLPVLQAARLAILGLVDGLGGPEAAIEARIHLTGLPPDSGLHDARRRAFVDAEAVALARRLVDARASEVTPEVLAERAVDIAHRSGLAARVWDSASLASSGMGGILAVGAGSTNPPALVELEYLPASWTKEEGPPPVCLIGKGVTFDSGGLSLKSPAAMVGMHSDKAGAVAVLAAMSALCDLRVSTPVRAYLPLAENLPGAGATRPGDVITMLDGTRVEVVDTDFEGRVLMADALTLACGSGASGSGAPQAVIDIATLTYQAVTALGPDIAALVARDRDLGRRILDAAERVGEPLWPLPWAPRYLHQTRSSAPGARLRNHPGTETGRALTAALFLGWFVPRTIPWAHLDIAGPAMTGSGADARATGYGVRTLIDLLEQWPTGEQEAHPADGAGTPVPASREHRRRSR